MTKENFRDGTRLSKFSNADRSTYAREGAEEKTEPSKASDGARDKAAIGKQAKKDSNDLPNLSDPKLASQSLEAPRKQRQRTGAREAERAAGPLSKSVSAGKKNAPLPPRPAAISSRGLESRAAGRFGRIGSSVTSTLRRLGLDGVKLMRRMGPKDWDRRRLALLTIGHRRVFDAKTERLLFVRTRKAPIYQITETEKLRQKTFVYVGPIARKVLYWAFSALPEDLKRYAFVDFDASNGRTLLLAARLNFEFVVGHVYDEGSREALEMNIAQYPRSYMSCRDVRVVRGDQSAALIPSQPAVLFFPDSLGSQKIEIILDDLSRSYRANPRPIYLIFENAGRERHFDAIKAFRRVPAALIDRIKLALLSPIRVAVYCIGDAAP